MNHTMCRVPTCSLLWRVLLFYTLVCMSTASAQEKESVGIVSAESLLVLKGSPGVPFRQPTDVSIGPNGHIYVMDGLNGRVVIFNKQGTYQNAFGSNGSGPGQMLMPVGIGISPSGEVYVADSGNHRIQVFSAQGSYIRSFSLKNGKTADPTDVLPSRYKNFCYVCDNENHQVQVYECTTGRFVKGFGGRGKNLGEFRYPATITSDSRDNIYVVDVINARVQSFDPLGNRAREIAGWGMKPGRLFRPKGVAVDRQERILISDSFLGYIQVFLSQGALAGIIGDANGTIRTFTAPTNIIVDNQDRLFVVETRASQISVLKMLN